MPSVKLTARIARESKAGETDIILFDKGLPGFGLRIHPSGRKVWIVQARIKGRSRRMVIARYGEMSLSRARRQARDMLQDIRAGGNPADDLLREKRTPTLKAFARQYLRRCDPYWKPSGRKTVRIYLRARILPAFGATRLDRLGPEDVSKWFDAASRDKPGAANRAFEILRSMMFRAEEWGFRERGTNPCLGIRKNPRRNVARFLDRDELARLGKALDAHEARWPEAVTAIRLLALTGCRRGEVLNLRWRDIRNKRACPPGFQDRPALGAARQVRAGHPGYDAASATQERVPVPEKRRPALSLQHRRMLAHCSCGSQARQAPVARSTPYRGKLCSYVRRKPTAGEPTARPSPTRDYGGLRSPCRRLPCRRSGESRKPHCRKNGL